MEADIIRKAKQSYKELQLRDKYIGKRMKEKGYEYAAQAYKESNELSMPQILSYLEAP